MINAQLREVAIAAEDKRLANSRNTRMMLAPDLAQAFTRPYVTERQISITTALIGIKRMSAAQLSDLAYDTACQFVGPMQISLDDYVEVIFNKLASKR